MQGRWYSHLSPCPRQGPFHGKVLVVAPGNRVVSTSGVAGRSTVRWRGRAGLEGVEDVGEGAGEDALHARDAVPRLDQVPQRRDHWQAGAHGCLQGVLIYFEVALGLGSTTKNNQVTMVTLLARNLHLRFLVRILQVLQRGLTGSSTWASPVLPASSKDRQSRVYAGLPVRPRHPLPLLSKLRLTKLAYLREFWTAQIQHVGVPCNVDKTCHQVCRNPCVCGPSQSPRLQLRVCMYAHAGAASVV